MTKGLLILFALTFVACASRVSLESAPHQLNSFRATRKRSAPQRALVLHLALSHKAPASEMEEALMSTARPDARERRPFFSRAELASLYSPADLEAVVGWLSSEGVPESRVSLVGHGDWLELRTTVREAERLFQCRFEEFERSGASLTRAASYSVPAHVAHAIDFVAGVKRLPPLGSRAAPLSARGSLVGPSDSRTLFGVPANVKGSASNGNSQTVAQFLGQYYSPSDSELFAQTYNLPSVPITVVGPNQANDPGVEASLDIQTVIGISQGTPTVFHSTGGLHDQQEPFLKWLLDLEGATGGPFTHSISYGDVESSLDAVYAKRVCTELGKLSTAGHTFFFASGDSGVTCNARGTQEPDFPASCPWVTSVGGVLLEAQPASWGGSGGGFSNLFARPAFMEAAQSAYINSHSAPSHSKYNVTGRGYPDLSAVSMNVAVAYRGSIGPVGGTSCAAPAIAGLFSLIKDVQINDGKAPLGYLNPSIYAWGPAVFTTVPAGTRNSAGTCQGFEAGEGWSPINGFGVPDYQKIVAQL